MKKIVIFLLCLGCVFLLLQCDKIENPDDEIFPIETWDYSKIAFIARVSLSNNSAPWFLFTVDKTGNNVRQIVEKPTTCSKPVCSRSGSKLLFSTLTNDYKHELYVVNTDGSELILIDRADIYCGNADWSPDDKYIVYLRCSDPYWNNSDLILYNISDKTHTVLQNEGNASYPKFSPNGKQIAYCKSNGVNENIYKMDINGNNNQLIIRDAFSPNWSPHGDKIAYLSSGTDRSSQIFVANADGSGQKQLTSSVSPEWWDTGFPRDGNEDPQWTLDGKKIVYVSWENIKPEIFIMNVDGSNKIRLTTAEFRDESPKVTPDGHYILFSSRRSDTMNGGICIMELDGSNKKVLFNEGIYPTACR
jgi:TolB protein